MVGRRGFLRALCAVVVAPAAWALGREGPRPQVSLRPLPEPIAPATWQANVDAAARALADRIDADVQAQWLRHYLSRA